MLKICMISLFDREFSYFCNTAIKVKLKTSAFLLPESVFCIQ